ncbi:hypothetical protein E3983_03775 [Legionella israelensis]|uniref:Uncharacterized protein n=1 Tax=Legionella israelensis TaxID=454 RepID=A0AAX1EEL7_9GAMM|nr:hypothetical protein [Legionella israelensis]QBR83553.1 hypothetical protein E3983_03775 [Legionella israelensis]
MPFISFKYYLNLKEELQKQGVNWLHGGSSWPLINALKPHSVVKALVPTGKLRKDYRLHPMSGETEEGTFGYFGSRKNNVNQTHLSGMPAPAPNHKDRTGLWRCLGYATSHYKPTVEHLIKVLKTLEDSNSEGKILSLLKTLNLRIQQLKPQDLKLYSQKIKTILATKKNNFYNNAESDTQKESIQRRCLKWHRIVEKSLNNPLNPDYQIPESFVFPVVFCVKREDAVIVYPKGSFSEEMIVEGEVPLKDIACFATYTEHFHKLKALVEELGLPGVVIDIGNPVDNTEKTSFDSAIDDIYKGILTMPISGKPDVHKALNALEEAISQDPNNQDDNGLTKLHRIFGLYRDAKTEYIYKNSEKPEAFFERLLDCIEQLLKNGADLDLKDIDEEKPEDWLKKLQTDDPIFSLIKKYRQTNKNNNPEKSEKQPLPRPVLSAKEKSEIKVGIQRITNSYKNEKPNNNKSNQHSQRGNNRPSIFKPLSQDKNINKKNSTLSTYGRYRHR